MNNAKPSAIVILLVTLFAFTATPAGAHCDALDGPVVLAAKAALQKQDVIPVLKWIKPADEGEIRAAFARTLKVRGHSDEARELADRYFFETLVRVHRAGEGEAYTGLKPAGKPDPAIAAADKALASGKLEPVSRLITERTHSGLEKHFHEALARKQYKPNDLAAGRAFVTAYVEYMHYVEKVYSATGAQAAHAAPRKGPQHGH